MEAKVPKTSSGNHGLIFSLLVALVLCSVGVSLFHFPVLLNNLSIFGVAVVMAALVLLQYMGLGSEGPMVVWLAIVPLIMFVIIVAVLLADTGHLVVNHHIANP